jgi:hypothetical protein
MSRVSSSTSKSSSSGCSPHSRSCAKPQSPSLPSSPLLPRTPIPGPRWRPKSAGGGAAGGSRRATPRPSTSRPPQSLHPPATPRPSQVPGLKRQGYPSPPAPHPLGSHPQAATPKAEQEDEEEEDKQTIMTEAHVNRNTSAEDMRPGVDTAQRSCQGAAVNRVSLGTWLPSAARAPREAVSQLPRPGFPLVFQARREEPVKDAENKSNRRPTRRRRRTRRTPVGKEEITLATAATPPRVEGISSAALRPFHRRATPVTCPTRCTGRGRKKFSEAAAGRAGHGPPGSNG